ncbi:hypothetical protein J2Y41_003899 [Arthrobacter sp. 1088]|nr:hypothetical protein [Arthrobacter sp. 1088]MDR6688313.1 hypothetical protein [Arthrobacter sp. 1088]
MRIQVAIGVVPEEASIIGDVQAGCVADLAETTIQIKLLPAGVVNCSPNQELGGRASNRRHRAAIGVAQKVVQAKADVSASHQASLNLPTSSGCAEGSIIFYNDREVVSLGQRVQTRCRAWCRGSNCSRSNGDSEYRGATRDDAG